MLVTNEIASITILVPRQKNDAVVNQIIPFKIFKHHHDYKAVPLISGEERERTGLSAEISFRFIANRIIPGEKMNEVSLAAINNIASELRILRIV